MRTVLLATLFLFGCVVHRPGAGVTPDFARSLGCDPDVIRSRAAALKAALPAGRTYIPKPGWDACELMAHVGAPQKIDQQATTTTRSMSWWYEYSEGVHLVTLSFDADKAKLLPGGLVAGCPWIVTYVGW